MEAIGEVETGSGVHKLDSSKDEYDDDVVHMDHLPGPAPSASSSFGLGQVKDARDQQSEPVPAWPEPFEEDFNDPDWPDLEASASPVDCKGGDVGDDTDSGPSSSPSPGSGVQIGANVEVGTKLGSSSGKGGTRTRSPVERWVLEQKRLLVRVCTWNLCARSPPPVEAVMRKLLPRNKFHVYVVGSEECERSIARSALNPSKKSWEAYLVDALGPLYVPLRSHTLQAIHIMVFVHKDIAHLCSVVTSAAVPTGVGSRLGNKGGVGVYLQVGPARLLVVNAHLAAHQRAERRRNAEFQKINLLLPLLLQKKDKRAVAVGVADTNADTNADPLQLTSPRESGVAAGQRSIVESVRRESQMWAAEDINGAINCPATGAVAAGVAGAVEGDISVADAPFGTSPRNTKHKGIAFSPAPGSGSGRATSNSNPSAGSSGGTGNAGSKSDLGPETNLTDGVEVGGEAGDASSATENISENISGENISENAVALSGSIAQKEPPVVAEADSINKRSSTSSNDKVHIASGQPTNSSISEVAKPPLTLEHQVSALSRDAGSDMDAGDASDWDGDGGSDVTPRSSSASISAMGAGGAGEAVLGDLDPAVRSSNLALEHCAELVVFMGDLNYRINGNRSIVSKLLDSRMHEVLLNNDQLRSNMRQRLVLRGFTEAPLTFKPTYKYDVGADTYDSSAKNRIPSWTDRVLFVPSPQVACLAYSSDDSITTSDHRPVYASFALALHGPKAPSVAGQGQGQSQLRDYVRLDDAQLKVAHEKASPEFTSESQVCSIS